MRVWKILLILMLSLALSACGAAYSEGTELKIVCTSFPCYDLARAVAGNRAEISLLIKPGSEVHSFEPTPADILSIAACDLFIYIGGESDAWVTDILESFGDDAPETLRMFDCVDALEQEETEEMTVSHDHHDTHAEYDEHIWTSQGNARAMVNATAEAICAIDPDGEDAYRQNALAYDVEITQIHTEILELVENADRKEMIFADRFPFLYFAEEYGLQYHAAFASCSSESEPSAKTLAYLIDKVISNEIPVIYTIELSSGKTAQTISEETGVEILTFHSIQNVTEEDFSAGETYISLMRRNVEALKKGLN